MPKKKPSTRKRRGLPGNRHAVIHGLYSRRIAASESASLASMRVTDITGEIAYLRVSSSRMAAIIERRGLAYEASQPLDDRTLRTMQAHDRKMNMLLKYLRQYAIWNGELSEYDQQLKLGEFLARKRGGVFDYLDPARSSSKVKSAAQSRESEDDDDA